MSTVRIADEYLEKAREGLAASELTKAAGFAHDAISLYKKNGEYEKMANSLNLIGVIYASMGDVSMAIDCYMEALEMATENDYSDVVMIINNNIGSIYQDLGKYEKAIKYFDNAMNLSKFPEHGDRNRYYMRMLMLNLNLCISYTGINKYEDAEKYLSEAMIYNEIINDPGNKFFIDITQAHLLWKTGNEDEVREHVDDLLDGAIKNIRAADYILEILSLCNLFMDMGEMEAWKKIIEAYEKFATETDNIFFKKTCVEMWMKYQRATGNEDAYNRLCVYYVNLNIQHENSHIDRLSDTIDLKLLVQEKELQRKKAVSFNYTDMLTGMGNKFQMRNDFEAAVAGNDDETGLTVGVIDIDYFKSFNRNRSHMTGDEVIKAISRIINSSIDGLGHGYHFYGDEFYVILNETDYDKIESIAERIKTKLEDRQIIHPASKAGKYITVSQAFVIRNDIRVPDEFIDVFKTVDEALHEVKDNGRNCYKVVEASRDELA